jgi:hypothetical protein
MGFWQKAREALDRAKDEAGDMARATRVQFDLRGLHTRRDELFGRIGRRVYAARDKPEGPGDLDQLFRDVNRILEMIKAKEAELQSVRGRGRGGPPATQADPAL